jgi:hypothetical protein
MSEAKTVTVNAVLFVDHAGQIFRIEQNGRRYEINDAMNVGNVAFGKIRVCEQVAGEGFP